MVGEDTCFVLSFIFLVSVFPWWEILVTWRHSCTNWTYTICHCVQASSYVSVDAVGGWWFLSGFFYKNMPQTSKFNISKLSKYDLLSPKQRPASEIIRNKDSINGVSIKTWLGAYWPIFLVVAVLTWVACKCCKNMFVNDCYDVRILSHPSPKRDRYEGHAMEMEASERSTGISTGHSVNLPVAHLIHGLLFVGTVGRNTLMIRDKNIGALRNPWFVGIKNHHFSMGSYGVQENSPSRAWRFSLSLAPANFNHQLGKWHIKPRKTLEKAPLIVKTLLCQKKPYPWTPKKRMDNWWMVWEWCQPNLQ